MEVGIIYICTNYANGVACANSGRKLIGIELDLNYFNIAIDRIEAAHGITK